MLTSVLVVKSMVGHSRDVEMLGRDFGSVAHAAASGTADETWFGLVGTGTESCAVLSGYHRLDCLLEPVAVVLHVVNKGTALMVGVVLVLVWVLLGAGELLGWSIESWLW